MWEGGDNRQQTTRELNSGENQVMRSHDTRPGAENEEPGEEEV